MKIYTSYLSLSCFLVSLPVFVEAQEKKEYKNEHLVQGKGSLNYRILYPQNFSEEKEYPVIMFHGGKGDVLVPGYSKTMAREIYSRGGNTKLSLYPKDNQNSVGSAFSEPYLLSWLFSSKKGSV